MTEQPTRVTPPGVIYERAAAFQRELALSQTAAQDQMLAAWGRMYEATVGDLQAVLDKVAAARAAGTEVSPAWLYQEARLRTVLATVEAEVATYASQAANATTAAQQAAVNASARHSALLGEQALAEGASMGGSFLNINPDNVRHLVGFLADGSPLSGLLAGLAPEVSESIRQALVVGVGQGKGIDWMARQVTQALDMPRHRAVTIMRTESQRAYRETARETYQENADVLEGWVWTATLGPRTCSACLVMHGTIHPVTATLDGHPRCRCAMVPRTPSWADLGVPDMEDDRPPVTSGKDWLEAQPDAVQQGILGRAKWQAWKDGRISLDDTVARTHSADWGTMRRERSLVEIRQGRHANVLPAQRVPAAPAPARPATLSEAQTGALMPKRGGWTTKTREQTLATLKATPEGRTLAKTLDAFQSGGSTAIPRLRTDIEKYLAGGEEAASLAEGRTESVRTLLRAIADTDAGDRPLFRGMSIPGSQEEVLARYAAGSEVNLSLASFSTDAKLAQGFSIKGAGQRVKGATQTPVVVEWVGESKRALPIENLGKSRVFAQEREWVGQGRYVVEETKVAKRAGVSTVVVRMRQVGTWE